MRTTKRAEVELLEVRGDRALVRVDRRLEVWVRLEALAELSGTYEWVTG